jgi:ribosomal protein L12E/L44/L45/RPP1/RPP2
MDTLRTITQAQVTDVDDTAADSLLAELAGPSEPELIELEPAEPGSMAIEPEQAQPADI